MTIPRIDIKYQDIPSLYEQYGSLSAIQRSTGASWGLVKRRYNKAVEAGLMDMTPQGRKRNEHYKAPTAKQRAKAMKTRKERHHSFILTSAQNNTEVHAATWKTLLGIAAYEDAKLYVSTFLYSKRGLGQSNDKAQLKVSGPHQPREEIWFDHNVVPYINNDRVEIAKGLVWCGELNILPTASRPLSGLEVYTGRASMVVPHVRLAMESIPTVGGSGAKLNFTTGTVTQRNYIQRKEGFKAEFHHSYGALLVEVDEDGQWWARQLNADSEGVIYDLDRRFDGDTVTTGNRVEALNLGDTHVDNLDPVVDACTFQSGGMVDTLQPKYLFVHDVLDFSRRSHHKLKDPYAMLKQHALGKESIKAEVEDVRLWLLTRLRKDMQIVVVDSNHDRHLDRWLMENDGRRDPVNAVFWGQLNAIKTNHIMEYGEEPSMLAALLSGIHPLVTVLGGDESFVICPKHHGGIECGMHGDRGANGARGSARQFAKMGRRSNVGHSHSASIVDGCYQAGTNSKLQLDYNHGPSSWSHSDIVTYPNGKRAIITIFNGKWRA